MRDSKCRGYLKVLYHTHNIFSENVWGAYSSPGITSSVSHITYNLLIINKGYKNVAYITV